MPASHRIKIQPLTDEAFRPFGEVLSRKESEPFFQMTDGRVQGWKADFSCEGPTEVAYMKVDFQSWVVEDMERHFQVTQTFIPLKGKPMIMVVARATDPDDRDAVPPPQEYSAFYMDGAQGVMLGVGTWHASARLALYPPDCEFVYLSSSNTTQDLKRVAAEGGEPRLSQVVNYRERFGQAVEPVW
ncbi:MAG: ureidoglycolate lyase [Dehalococcoidia bacterium]|nr:ureidoglycolate lyase [Dehalococcoidia bacterium]